MKYSFFKRGKAVAWNKLHRLVVALSRNDNIDVFLISLRHWIQKECGRLRIYPSCEVVHYVQGCGGSIRIMEKAKKRTVYMPKYFEKKEGRAKQYHSDAIYVAELRNVCVVGGSDLMLAGHKFLSDVFCKDSRVDIRFGCIKKAWNNRVLVAEPSDYKVIEQAISLLGAASFNYFHLLMEILPRLFFLNACKEFRTYPILVDEVVLKIPQYAALLRYIDQYDHKVIAVRKDEGLYVRQLAYVSNFSWMPVNLKDRRDILPYDFRFTKTVLENIRRCIPLYDQKPPWRKLFLSRKHTGAVRLINETAICAIFMEYGFEVIYPEELSLEQQVECFGQAACIVAASGAAFANMVFCQKGTRVGCIIPLTHRFYMYSTIAYLLELEPVFLDADITKRTACTASDEFVLEEAYARRYAESLDF